STSNFTGSDGSVGTRRSFCASSSLGFNTVVIRTISTVATHRIGGLLCPDPNAWCEHHGVVTGRNEYLLTERDPWPKTLRESVVLEAPFSAIFKGTLQDDRKLSFPARRESSYSSSLDCL